MDGVSNLFEYQSGTSASDQLDVPVNGVIQWQLSHVVTSTMNPVTFGVDGSMYITEQAGWCHKLDSSGVLQWSVNVTGGTSPINDGPMLAPDGNLYVVSAGTIYRVNNSGTLVDTVFDIETVTSGAIIQYKPSLSQDGLLYVVDNIGNIYAIDPVAKNLVYAKSFTSRQVPVVDLMRPVIDEAGTAVIGIANSVTVYTISASRKSVKTITLDYPLIKERAIVANGNGEYLATVLKNGNLPVMERVMPSGKQIIVNQITDDALPVITNTIVKQNVNSSGRSYLFGSSVGLVFEDAGGWPWKHLTGNQLTVAPAASSNHSIYIAQGNTLIALSDRSRANAYEDNLDQRWSQALNMAIETITVFDGYIYATNSNGDIAKISDTNGGANSSNWMMEGRDPQKSYNLTLNAGSYLVNIFNDVPELMLAQNDEAYSPLLKRTCGADYDIPYVANL